MLKSKEEAVSFLKQIVKIIVIIVFAIVVTGVSLFAIESFIRWDTQETVKWINENTNPFLLNYLILFILFLLFLGIFNDVLISAFVFALFTFLLAFINRYKVMFLGENLYPWDVLLYQQLFNLFPQLMGVISLKKLLAAVVGLAFAVASIIFFKKKIPFFRFKLTIFKRVALILLSAGLLVSFFLFRSTPLKHLFNTLNITNMNWNQNTNYRINGFLLSFVLNTESTLVFPPQGYGQDKIMNVVQQLQEELPEDAIAESKLSQNPNIIIVMNESFWDPTQLETVSFSEDPMPTIRENQSGWLLSPQFGGGTANIEFEALTGMSVSFLPAGSIAYQQFISRPIPSLASVLAEQGYDPVAIHPYYEWFWNRDKVYDLIGFKEFISLNDFKGAQYRGPYIADKEVNKKIFNVTEKTDKPVFIYAVTMQNHGPYEKNRYKELDVTIKNNELSEEAFDALQTYTQGIVEADQAFAELIQYYEKSEEPTIIVLFGDHLPFLGNNYLTYIEANFLNSSEGESWSLEDYHKMRTTPLVLWSNYMDEKIKFSSSISPSFLAPYLFDMAQLEKPLYYRFLEQFNEKLPGFSQPVKNDPDGNLYKQPPDNVTPLADRYIQLQYDLLFGKQYGRKQLFIENK